jgi:hypothetical protein
MIRIVKQDISLAARSASHLYVTTSPIIYSLFILFTVVPLNVLFTEPYSPILIIECMCMVLTGVGLLALVLYARRRLNSRAYLVGALCVVALFAIFCIGIWQAPPDEYVDSSDRYIELIPALLAAIYLVRVVDDYIRLTVLRKDSAALSRLQFADELSMITRDGQGSRSPIHTPTHPIRASLFAIIFIVSAPVVYVYGSFLEYADHKVNPKSDSLVSFLPWTTIFGLIYLASIAALARRHYVLRADKLLQLDDRRPIIFLRSFADDNVRLWGKGIVGKLRRRTIDEAIRSVCEQIGPFVAIASPKTKLPRLGAAQVYFSDDTWQSAIARWVAMAELIVMVAGRTEGLRWELEHILSNKERTKLMVILPPAMRKSIKITSEWFREYFCRTIYAEGLSTMDLTKAIGIVFLDDRLFIIETQRIHKREVDYLVAMQAAVFATVSGNRTVGRRNRKEPE